MREAAEHHLEVVRTARYWVLGEHTDAPAEIWFVLHGYKQLARRFLRRFGALDDGSRWVVAPEGLSRFYAEAAPGRHGPKSVVGATWMTREDRENEIADYVRYLDALAETVTARVAGPPRRIVVLGFSQGVATACRWTVLGRLRPARLLLWGDFLPPDLPLAQARDAWRETEVALVRGSADRIFSDQGLAADEAARLIEAGIQPRRVPYDGGHDIDQRTLQALAAEGPGPQSVAASDDPSAT